MPRAFHEYPESSQRRAAVRRSVIWAYFGAIFDGQTKVAAGLKARAAHVLLSGKDVTCNCVRRWATKAAAHGWPVEPPMEVFLDGKSCPHPRAKLKARQKRGGKA